jgi:hypothetical protein
MLLRALSLMFATGLLAVAPGVAAAQAASQAEPGRQTMTVWFHRPVKIGDRILLGQYVIEHDTVRMARGRPCTHVYAASDQRLRVVAFHCTHLKRPAGEQPRVVLRPLGEANGMMAFAEFQFAGEDAGHGVPTGR